jgi:hypothetical protein
MYIESKAENLNGPARIGRVTFSKTGLSIYYGGKTFIRTNGFKRTMSMKTPVRSTGSLDQGRMA